MHQILLNLHSLNRWLVLIFIGYALYTSIKGYLKNETFGKNENLVRHLTATIAHVQLLLGLGLYMISPIVKFNGIANDAGLLVSEHQFFRYAHILLMLIAVVLITIGSAKAKRANTDKQKFLTMLIWFSLGLLVIFVAIPWPFSPLANRPLFRPF